MSERAPKLVLCFGELLWDSLPRGLFPGRAPMNVAYHLKQLGVYSIPVTAGASGAGLLLGPDWLWEPGTPMPARDTVGGGQRISRCAFVWLDPRAESDR